MTRSWSRTRTRTRSTTRGHAKTTRLFIFLEHGGCPLDQIWECMQYIGKVCYCSKLVHFYHDLSVIDSFDNIWWIYFLDIKIAHFIFSDWELVGLLDKCFSLLLDCICWNIVLCSNRLNQTLLLIHVSIFDVSDWV